MMTDVLRRSIPLLLTGALLLAGCAPAAPEPSPPEPPIHTSSSQPEDPAPPDEPLPPEPLGVGTTAFSQPGELTPGQQETILALLTRYYDSLAELELRGADDLFAPGADTQRLGNRAVWEYMVEVRRMQRTDLSLLSYTVELDCREMEEGEDGSITLLVAEDSVQRFRATPDVDSEQRNVYHRFTLEPLGEDRWAIAAHSQLDTLYWTVMGLYAYRPLAAAIRSPAEIAVYYEERVEQLLETARQDVTLRFVQGEERDISADHLYDREAAVAYARRWVGERSGDWPDYSRNGGNCQNFVSQCLLAGGIPMDTVSPGIWKWYGSTPDDLPRPAGRSAAWSAVGEFLDYARENSGYGLAAVADAPYYTGRPGDVIHLGTGEDWRHTVIISQVVADGEGNIEDYLICSNTADLRDFPVSAYAYTRQLLIRVEGWNGW